jgi:GTPase SAR1 family protein
LEQLILSNEWGEFKAGKWRKVESNNRGGLNILRHLPRELQNLNRLVVLIAGGDWNFSSKDFNAWTIADINWIRNMHHLEYLNLSNNNLQNFPDISRLKNIRVLHLNNNKISKVGNLKKLVLLEEIYLSNNLIDDVNFLADVKNLKTIDLHSNQIRDITALKSHIEKLGISNSKWETNTINIASNPLETPPIEVINIGKEAVLGYFRDIKLGKPFINDEIKLILVGNSEVGKTTLAKYLDNEKKLTDRHDPTLWMEERHIQSKYKVRRLGGKCIINLFDFGGHDYYHDTHHLLFGTNCLYIVLWDKETNRLNFRTTHQTFEGREIKVQVQDYPLKYWLDSVKHFSKEIETENFDFDIEKERGYNSLALVIQNKVNSFEEIDHLDNKGIKKNYPFIFEFLNMSIINERRNLEYFDSVFTEMLEKGNLIGAKLPGYYGVIKESLINYNGNPILDIEEFRQYCNRLLKPAISLQQARFLAHYLKQLGIVLFYPKGNPDDKIFLKKDWILKSIYVLFEKLPERGGEFKESYIYEVLRGNLSEEYIVSFIEILLEFKVIVKHPLDDSYIAPLYLPLTPSSTVKLFIDEVKIPHRRFIYNGFIHKNVTLSLFQEYGRFALAETKNYTHFSYYWKDGLIIKDPATGELILIQFFIGDNDGNAFIDIVKLNKLEKSKFSEDLISFIKTINKDFDIEEMVTVDGENFVSLDILNTNAKNGKLIFTEKRKKDLEEEKPLITYHKLKDFIMFLDDGIKRKKVVISYSKKDLTRVHTFIRYLKPLVDLELIEQPWYCTLANPGDVWDEKIQSKFKEADFVFFMVSEYFYSVDYIVKKEIKTVIDRYDFDKSVKIIPIILEHYDWERKPPYNLKRFSAMPFQAKPVSDFNNEKLAWNTITSAVRKMIEMDLDPADTDLISREMQEFYERQVEGKLDKNS